MRFTNAKIPDVDVSLVGTNTKTGMRKMIAITFFIWPPEPREQSHNLPLRL
jgi:hypothetical protein